MVKKYLICYKKKKQFLYKGSKELLWKIVKKYNKDELVNNESCLNLPMMYI